MRRAVRTVHVGLPDARKPPHKLRNGRVGVDVGLELVQDLAAMELDRANLDYPMPVGVQTRCLQINGRIDPIIGIQRRV